MIIVIDGPSGSGKSTVAKRLASELHFDYFDTGAMYRSVCWYLLKENISFEDENAIKEALKHFHFEIKKGESGPLFFVNEHDVSLDIRSNAITQRVSQIAAYSFVRKKMVEQQQAFGHQKKAVFEGRDMGTVVFPKADVKFFLIANAKVRAERRLKQLQELYPTKTFHLKEVEEDIIKRDEIDSTRECSPLKQAKDAIAIDSSNQSVDDILKLMKSHIKEKSS